MTTNPAEAYVARGAALLDSTLYGWWRDVDILEIAVED